MSTANIVAVVAATSFAGSLSWLFFGLPSWRERKRRRAPWWHWDDVTGRLIERKRDDY